MSNIEKFYSHPGKLLITHILNVVNKMSMDNGKIGALFHDVGKINSNFQEGKLKKNENIKGYSSHAYPSAIVFLSYIQQYGFIVLNKTLKGQDILMILLLICRHHGRLINPIDLFNKDEIERISNYLKEDYDFNAKKFLVELKLEHKDFRPFAMFNGFKKLTEGLSKKIDNPTSFYFDTRMSFSELVTADKGDAGNYIGCTLDIDEFKKLHHEELNDFLKILEFSPESKEPLNIVRNSTRKEMAKNLTESLKNDQRVFSLATPTGSGKTYIMDVAADIIMQYAGAKRCIYALPFLSITEQIYSEFTTKVYKKCSYHIDKIDSKSDMPHIGRDNLDKVKNNNLFVDIVYKVINKIKNIFIDVDEKEKQNILNRAYCLNSFDHNMIITTFVRFFEAFTTTSNSELMKLKNMRNCIFLIDEIQALPPRLYIFFAAIINEFCIKYDSYAVLSTATMPCFEMPLDNRYMRLKKLFPNYSVPVNLVNEDVFQEPVFNRYNIIDDHFNCDYKSLSEKILSTKESCMVIMSTIKDSIDVYSYIKTLCNHEVILLNTRFHATGRLMTIKKCQQLLKEKKKIILITTSLIEAGVDIDFPIVFRDVCPLTSLIQAGGRSNREGKLGKKGLVIVFRYYSKDINGRKYLSAKMIYKGSMKNIFNYYYDFVAHDKISYEEKELIFLQKDYFNFVSNNLECGMWDDGLDMIEEIENGHFEELGKFRVVPDSIYGEQHSYYVPFSNTDEEYEKLRDLYAQQEALDSMDGVDIRDKLVNRANIDEQMRKISSHVVSIRLKENEDHPATEYDYEVCGISKAVLGIYNEEYGLN